MNKKRNIILALALMLSTVMITGLTFAYFSAKSDIKHNTFTIGNGISIQLAEPNFDGLGYDGKGTTVTVAELGKVSAENIMPSRVIAKNPSVKNTSAPEAVWVAIKLDYTISGEKVAYADATAINKLSDFAKINFDTVAWETKAESDYTVFYYKTSVLPDKNTSELFTNVIINKDATELHPFTIDVTAYAVQAEGLEFGDAMTELDSLME